MLSLLRTPLASLLCVLVLLSPAAAARNETPYILVDLDGGTVIADHDAHQLWYPASLTKLMTAYVVFRAMGSGQLTPDSPVIVTANALAEPPSKMGFRKGTVLTVDNALKMVIVKSANDIAMALGEAVGGSEAGFVALMNAEAQRLGMTGTRFENPNGLPSAGQVTTARDLAVLARAIWVEFPHHRPLFAIPAIRSGKSVMRSQNKLLDHYRGANGMKTGFICASGLNLVATATRHGRSMLAVVLGATNSADRAETAARLLEHGFNSTGLSFRRPALASFTGSSPVAMPVDMRSVMCERRPETAEGEDDAETAPSLLGQRFAVAEPVPVFTSGIAIAADSVPLPRPRPERALAATATAPATAAAMAMPYAGEPPPEERGLLLVPVPRPRP